MGKKKKHWITERFWMILVLGSERPPKVRQYSFEKALKEAARLAELTGRRAYVLEAHTGFQRGKGKKEGEIISFLTNQTKIKGPAQPPKKIKPPKLKEEKSEQPINPKISCVKPIESPKLAITQKEKHDIPVVIVKKRRIAVLPVIEETV